MLGDTTSIKVESSTTKHIKQRPFAFKSLQMTGAKPAAEAARRQAALRSSQRRQQRKIELLGAHHREIRSTAEG